jgi:hypothetical protein
LILEIGAIEEFEYREGVIESRGKNATAKDLGGFINSVKASGGYYFARYEASYASGAINNNVLDYSNCKAASKISILNENIMNYIPGTLWNNITQPNASKVSINTYSNSSSVISDLVNSYAWDTAIVYIQAAGNINYANKDSVNSVRGNTGNLGNGLIDEVCKINDMASNCFEYTTESSDGTNETIDWPVMGRGGFYDSANDPWDRSYVTFTRLGDCAINMYPSHGFRMILFMI